MNRIEKKFQELKSADKKAFIAFITAGDPSLDDTIRLVLAFEKAGVDIVELGVPFSDPLADGPVIQAASYRALQKGVTSRKILAAVREIRKSSDVPIALMTYYNPVFRYGEAEFVKDATEAGVDGVIIPDLPVEEAGNFCREARKSSLATIFLLTPTTPAERVPTIVRASSGFVYFVSVAGVTGARSTVPAGIGRRIRLARKDSATPVCVGFGVSTPEQVKELARLSDGVIVGSAIVKEIERHSGKVDMVDHVSSFVANLAGVLGQEK